MESPGTKPPREEARDCLRLGRPGWGGGCVVGTATSFPLLDKREIPKGVETLRPGTEQSPGWVFFRPQGRGPGEQRGSERRFLSGWTPAVGAGRSPVACAVEGGRAGGVRQHCLAPSPQALATRTAPHTHMALSKEHRDSAS